MRRCLFSSLSAVTLLACAVPIGGCAARRPPERVDVTGRPEYQLRYRSGEVYEAVRPLQITRFRGGKWLAMAAVGSAHALRPDHHAVVAVAPPGTRVRVERLSRWYEAATDSYNVYPYGRYVDGPAAGQPTGLAGLYDELNPTRLDGKRTVFFEPDPQALRKVGAAATGG